MSFQQIPKGQSESPPIPPANSQVNPEPPTRLQNLPVEILGQICQDSREEEMGVNPGNITRSLPTLVTSFKCGVNDQRRKAYIYLLDVCSKTFVYSLHFGNNWKLPIDSEEGGVVRNIVIKYVPGIRGHHSSDPWRFGISRNSHVASDTNSSAGQSIVVKDEGYYCWSPMPEVVNPSLDSLPNLRLIQLEFKTFCSSFGSKSLGMCRILQSFLDYHKDFKLKSATIEPKGITPWDDMPRFMISQVTVMAGHEVCFDVTDKRIWKLKAFGGQKDVRSEVVNLNLEFNEPMRNPELVEVLRGSKWTWVLEREEK
ncbi:hypothetical protein ACHAO8_009849 [Botrytis cinerea]